MSDSEPPTVQKEAEALPKRVIPKFTSFKAPPPAAPSITPARSPALRDPKESKESRERRYSHHGRHRSKSKGRDHESGRDRGRNSDRGKDPFGHRKKRSRESSNRHGEKGGLRLNQNELPASLMHKTTIIQSSGVPTFQSLDSRDILQRQYCIDTRGDEDNLIYGTIYRYIIPAYVRRGGGYVIGLPTNMRIDRDAGDGQGLVLKSGGGKENTSARSMHQEFAKLDSRGGRRLRVKKNDTGLDEAFSRCLDFIPLSTRTKKRKNEDPEAPDELEDEQNDYRSLDGPKKVPALPVDQDLQFASDSESARDYYIDKEWGNRKHMVEFARNVETHPDDIEAWLAYVAYQDTIISSSGRRKTAAENKSTAEVKLDILTKALDKNPGHEVLLLKYMEVAREIWDSQKLLSKWKTTLQNNPIIINLWIEYINFRQTDFLSFTYPECIRCFADCLTVLRSAAFRSNIELSDRHKLDTVALYIFVRTIHLMDDAGYKENAIACLQAMLELNLFSSSKRPPTSEQEFEGLIVALERFWDSEVPRIGEMNALGWASFIEAGENGEPPTPTKTAVSLPSLNSKDPFGLWGDAEMKWIKSVGLPARTIDEVEEDDPYRVVLFSDLRAFMFSFSNELVRKQLIDVMLIFKNMQSRTPRCSNNNSTDDIFLCSRIASMSSDCVNDWFWPKKLTKWDVRPAWEGMEPEKKPRIGDNPFEFKIRNFYGGHETIFSKSTGWFQGMNDVHVNSPQDTAFIRNALKMLVERVGDEFLALYYLGWEWRNATKGVKKVAKILLKRFKTSLRLWGAYAQIEWHDSGIGSGRNVFSMALGMSKGFLESSRNDTVFLWHTWIWEEILAGNAQDALWLILASENGEPPKKPMSLMKVNQPVSKALVLKARRYLEDRQHYMSSMKFEEHAAAFNDIRAVLEYLANGLDIDAAIAVHDTFITELDRRGMAIPSSLILELCHLRKVRLIYRHSVTARPFKPVTLRTHLETALKVFPKNTAFLGLYAWNECRTRIENRVRKILRDRVLLADEESVVGWLFSVWVEIRLGQNYSIHGVRYLLEKAVECRRTRASVVLWKTYMHFELLQKDFHRAKEVFFRAIRYCPWSKDLYLMAFTSLERILDFDDKRKMLSIMSSEKEIRVHDVTELEDTIEEIDNERITRRGLTADLGGVIELPEDPSSDDEMMDE